MALFGSQTDTEQESPDDADTKSKGADGGNQVKAAANAQARTFSVLKHPRITEKTTRLAEEQNVYTFVVREDANKKEIKQAVAEAYDVTPTDVRTTAIPSKQIRQMQPESGEKSGGKKAYVTLKDDDSIELL